MTLSQPMLGQLPGVLTGLGRADQRWQQICQGQQAVPAVVTVTAESLPEPDWDVVICGGTLGILLGAVLAQQGWRVALMERGALRGREQEWNISRHELQTVVQLGLLTTAELESAIATEYNPARIQFHGGDPVWVKDVLNVGVDPVRLLDLLKQRFLAAGGKLLEHTAFASAMVYDNGVAIAASNQPQNQSKDQPEPLPEPLRTRLLVDAMGHFSPIAQQARQGESPDSVCLVVGTCAQGYPSNNTGDLMVSFTPIQNQCQYFWEAFPARDGRTTYLFTYLDAQPERPSLHQLFDDYFALLPEYQGIDLADLTLQRALFGFFPCYRDSPLRYPWNRLLAVGDSSGSQSPLSFGGFGAMVRHLPRLGQGIHEALTCDALDADALGLLQPYQPNLAVTWLFQQAMSVGLDQTLDPDQINRTLATIFSDMASLGDGVMKPFLQDVVQFPALAKTLFTTMVRHPGLVLGILPQVGPGNLVSWLGHYLALAGYSAVNYGAASPLGQRLESFSQPSAATTYRVNRWRDALRYGTGGDYGQR
jgi:lycopene cyclase CruP